ncbi:MAG TPA: hypothetical protein VGQ60_01635 [Nitrospiraceae bacterium]|jgi:hypothetical protein|nr:hypothetical protein [Nitrospiraceae bacterium]
MNGPQYAVPENRTFFPMTGEKVFLCQPDAEKGFQLRSRSLVSLRRTEKRTPQSPTLPAASLVNLFEHPQKKI